MVDVPIKPEQGKLKRIIKPLFLIILAHVIVIYIYVYVFIYTYIHTVRFRGSLPSDWYSSFLQ